VIFAFISGALGGFFYSVFDKKADKKTKINDFSITSCPVHSVKITFTKRVKNILHYSFIHLAEDLALYLVAGFIVAGAISAFIPDDFFKYIGNGILGKLLILLIATPMYICSTASIPIAIALISKGVSPGTAFIFLMAGPATNAASVVLLIKSFDKKFTALFIAVITSFAIGGGYLLDFAYSSFNLPLNPVLSSQNTPGHGKSIFTYIISALFTALMIYHIIKNAVKYIKSKKHGGSENICGCTNTCDFKVEKENDMSEKINLNIEGMSCNHCLMAVKKALEALKGVSDVKVDLKAGKASLNADGVDNVVITDAVKEAGYNASVA
jgi:copper chaperone CopZ